VIDLEATCDYDPHPIVDPALNAEIIEFPWVVLDTESLEVIHEERYYVRPDRLEGVTPYCTGLTGISKETVANSTRLDHIIDKFTEFVEQRFPDSKEGDQCRSFRVVTDGVWDLQVQLLLEAQRKGITLPWYLRQYFDLKIEYTKCFPYFYYKNGPPLHSMLKSCNLQFVGRHHCGIDDCKTIALMIKRLITLRHEFKEPTIISEDYDPLVDTATWNKFENVTPAGAWQCSVCKLWNKPYHTTCSLCPKEK
jgi:inhibitor of KinA sporulation pathway (predicted exonuclease)